MIQIAIWNDYGEGTVIEPTKTFEYQYLEEVQKYTKTKASVCLVETIYNFL